MVAQQPADGWGGRTIGRAYWFARDAWRRLDRGWRACVLGLLVVLAHLLAQTI